jgi:hypothetical protein
MQGREQQRKNDVILVTRVCGRALSVKVCTREVRSPPASCLGGVKRRRRKRKKKKTDKKDVYQLQRECVGVQRGLFSECPLKHLASVARI